jgi:hypothetical protein
MGPFSDAGMPIIGQIDGGVSTTLPSVPSMTNVVAALNDDSVSITFDPVDGALDYRVYPLPQDSDIAVQGDGSVVVHNGTYRCAGDRETPVPIVDNGAMIASDLIRTEVDQVTVGGFMRTMADATLGYVYPEPGPGLVPVYALGESDPNADNTCFFARWTASRTKKYTTSDSERTQLLAGLARDDGIAFYVPAAASSMTTQIYMDEYTGTDPRYKERYYFPDGPEVAMRPTKTPAFPILTAQAPGTLPLMRVFYANGCGWSHDELAVGKERFNRIYKQGDALPWWSLLWTGLTGPTTLVVEALDSGCPYQGHFSPMSMPAVTGMFNGMPLPHEPFVTVDDIRAKSATGEVFLNGQHDTTTMPKAIARAFVNVVPNPHPKMDFFADFSTNTPPETFTPITTCASPDGNCFQTWRMESPTWDMMFMDAEIGPSMGTGLYAYGPVMGEFWETFADIGGDTNGKFRMTAKQMANMDSATFLHVTMEVDAYSTARRYPQILVSDQTAPVQYQLPKGHTVIVQTRAPTAGTPGDFPVEYQLQVCNMVTWDVNQQCPVYNLAQITDSSGNIVHLMPNDEVGEHSSVDHRIVFDAYLSTQRTYLFLDGKPYACANMPATGVPSGPVSVTFGDVLYHSQVDRVMKFHAAHLQLDTRRHFDNLGFTSGVPAPGWDESRLPCAAPITL